MFTLIATLAGAGAIHLAVAPAHPGALGIGFAVAGCAQLLVALALAARGGRPVARLQWVALLLSIGALAAWAVSRTVGLPFGEHAGVAEAVTPVDAVCVGLEAVTIAVAARLLAGRTRRAGVRWPSAFVGSSVALLTVLAVTSPAASEHTLGSEDAAHDHEHADEEVAAASTGEGHEHAHAECTEAPTAEQTAAADELVAATRTELLRWVDLADAEAEGFRPITPVGLPLVHYANPAWMVDGRVLDATRPESLMYAALRGGEPILLGAMYMANGMVAGPQVGGCLTQWHVHTNLCMADDGRGVVGAIGPDGSCPEGSINQPTGEMLHVWGIDLPSGPFAESQPREIRDALLAGRHRSLPRSGITGERWSSPADVSAGARVGPSS